MSVKVHRRTPSLMASDGRGLPVRQVAYLRTVAGETAAALVTRQQHDVAGRRVTQQDPRLPTPNITTVYGLGGTPLKIDSVDAGWRLSLPGLAGETSQRWDERGSHWRMTYDNQLRVVAVEENARPDVDTFTYADASADAGHNLRGQLLALVDPSGTLRLGSYGLLGQPLGETRTFHDAKAFVSHRTYNPLGAVLEQIDAGEHQQQSRYDLAGQIKQVQLRLKGQTDWQPVLQDAQYNAAGQIIEQQAGNGVISRWRYDPTDARLQRQSAQENQQPSLQDFEYEYDPVGNVTRILDHVFTPSHFANQRVDGHREFRYDSLYRLHSASGYDDGPPSDIPGLPQPTDPNNRLNYTQTYDYDHGGNLIKLCHVREGACHTREMFIDPASNRGVRWTPGDPDPQFDRLFDRHGNLLALQPGQPMQWNARDQLTSVTLVHRDNGPDDEEHYRYSQGVRVYKRHETHTAKTSHIHEVRYLPGLEIRTKDNGEELHVITLTAGFGSVRCLHWENDPANIGSDQLRYSLDDHLGSCLMELDQQAQLISHEGYYPFGATAWMAARSLIEVVYKIIRYSGKEMDVSGLYYYGARYYAPWLQRWVSADPAGDVDGLNLYGFVGNNPTNYFDDDGQQRTPDELKAVIDRYSNLLTTVESRLNKSIYQFNNLNRTRDIYKSSGKRAALTLVNVLASAMIAGVVGSLAITAGTLVTGGNVAAGSTIGIGTAALAADVAGNAIDSAGQKNAFGYPLLPKSDDYDLGDITKDAEPVRIRTEIRKILEKYDPRQTDGNKETLMAGAIGAADTLTGKSTHLEKFLAFFRLSVEMTEALNDTLGPRDLELVEQGVYLLSDFLNTEKKKYDSALEELENLGGKHIALAAGTRRRLEETETVVKGKMQRVLDLRPRVTEHLQRKKAV
ncbi:RHS repeat-associated core domain-containing protein [Pseudomonas sp. P9_31]|uniref:RHS repeat-associated core domain-containing protein n=1 Tax=Pseudomonas sp. P9_31 TaxID=3043448 RepID=UPI002A3600E8|nr:RHS repeat-associated core domain-containing protein [Pseudomonas sp. P9_31]WPN59272.1 RHS repeat-associated core domain-containing protein [Pseudomonas sp. P9_31]